MNIRYKITGDTKELVEGDSIQCLLQAEGGICNQHHFGWVVRAEPNSKTIVVRFNNRPFTEIINRSSVKRAQHA